MPASVFTWDSIPTEELNEFSRRQTYHGERITMARLYLEAGAVVGRHSHPNEQITVLEQGRLKFIFDDGDVVISAGQVMQIPGGIPHRVEALERSRALDLFSPVRGDWLRGEDAYLRHPDSTT